MNDKTGSFKVGKWHADPLLGQIVQGEKSLRLQPKTMNVLVYLASHAQQVSTREDLLENVWGRSAVSDEPLTRCIAELRKALGDRRGERAYIETIPKRGYRLIADVSFQREKVGPDVTDASQEPNENSVAVLPLRDLSPQQDQQYFAEGIAEEITAALASRSSLKVVAYGATRQLAGEELQSIRQKLNVRYVVIGSVRKAGETVRITVSLADSTEGYEVWSQSFDRKLEDIFAIQSDIANSVVTALPAQGVTVQMDPGISLTPAQVMSNDLYFKGLHEMRPRTRSGMYAALEHFAQAYETDPECIKALAGGACVYAMMPWFGLATDNKTSYVRAVRMAKEAIALDPGLADAYIALGMGLSFQYEWQAGEQAFLRALELNPGHVHAHQHYSTVLGLTGQFEAALDQSLVAEKIDPLSPAIGLKVGLIQISLGDIESGLGKLEDLSRKHEDYVTVWTFLSRVYLDLGEFDKARNAMARDIFMTGLSSRNMDEIIAAISRHRETGDMENLPDAVQHSVSQPAVVGRLYAQVGDYLGAIQWFERAVDLYDPFGLWLMIDSELEPMQDLPAFRALKKRVGLS